MFSNWRHDRGAGRTATVLVAGSVIGLNVAFGFLIHGAFPGLRFFPQDDPTKPAAAATTVSVLDIAARTGKTPAQVVVDLVLATPPKSLPSGATPVSEFHGVPSTPVDLICGARTGPGPVTAKGRGWTVANGSQVTNFKAGYTVTMSAYGAGQGAVAFTALKAQVNTHCANTNGTAYIVTSSGTGTDAATAWVNRSGVATTAFFWRRGDLIAMVATTGYGVPMSIVKEYDARIAAALQGVCVTSDSVAGDGSRSPYAGGAGFTGLTVPRPVGLPAGVTAPPTISPTTPVQVPEVTLPSAPADPYWPAALPTPVPAPTAPPELAYPALTVDVPVRVKDDLGPGCGWAFTGQPAPAFDQAQADLAANADQERAGGVLAGKVAAFSAALPGYQAAYAKYLTAVTAFQVYASAVDAVAASWAVIEENQTQYGDALALYTTAVTARDKFLAEQVAAKLVYDGALSACKPVQPAPTPDPTITPDPGIFPSPAPTVSPTTSPTTSPPVCPPVPAPIMTKVAPTVPPSPTPPPDPRPTPTATPTR